MKQPHKETLLERLNETPLEKLQDAVKKSEGFSVDDENNHKRGVKKDYREATAKIKIKFVWFLFYVLCLVIAFLSLGFLGLLGKWITSFVDDPIKLGDFLKNVAWAILVILATLFAESVFKKDD